MDITGMEEQSTFSNHACEQKLNKDKMRTEGVCEAQELYFVQTFPERLGEQC